MSNSVRELKPHVAVRFEGTHAETLTAVLSLAFHNEPSFTYILPDEGVRRDVLHSLLHSCVIPAAQLCGEIYTTSTIDGGALWISPDRVLAFDLNLRTEMLRIPFSLGRASLRRAVSLSSRIDEVHKRLAGRPHWYLMAHGVEPSMRGRGIGRALIEPVLSRADSDGLPCYLETFQERHLPFYERFGFQIEGCGRIRGDGPNFWAMVRAPRMQLTAGL